MSSLFSKVWSAGEKLLASDLNANFNETFKQSLTASGAISANDVVKVASANTVKKIGASAQETGASVSTSPSHTQALKFMPMDTAGLYLHFSGGDKDNSAVLYAQVRTMNAGETDFTNGSEATVEGSAVYWYDVCKIGAGKFLVIYQQGASSGIKCRVLTVSGTTITVGSATTIETTGDSSAWNSCCKLNTDKALITYRKDSNGYLVCQVLTVSGTTITTNTPVDIKTTSSSHRMVVRQLATDSACIVYNLSSPNTLYGKVITVSSTTPSLGSEQTIDNTSGSRYMIGMETVNSTKLILVYGDDGGGAFNDRCSHIAVSGNTLTKSGYIALASARSTWYFGFAIIGNTALVADHINNTSYRLTYINTAGTDPVEISNQTLSCNDISGINEGIGLVQVSPYIYVIGTSNAVGDYIVKLTQETGPVGLAESDIADTVAGNILMRYHVHTLSGITLSPGTIYYNNDNGALTTKSSSRNVAVGIAISTTKILIT